MSEDRSIFGGSMAGLAAEQRAHREAAERAPDGGWTIRVDPPRGLPWHKPTSRKPNPWRAHAWRGAERVEATGATEDEAHAALRAKLGLSSEPPATV